jgi:hypothetical protein
MIPRFDLNDPVSPEKYERIVEKPIAIAYWVVFNHLVLALAGNL